MSSWLNLVPAVRRRDSAAADFRRRATSDVLSCWCCCGAGLILRPLCLSAGALPWEASLAICCCCCLLLPATHTASSCVHNSPTAAAAPGGCTAAAAVDADADTPFGLPANAPVSSSCIITGWRRGSTGVASLLPAGLLLQYRPASCCSCSAAAASFVTTCAACATLIASGGAEAEPTAPPAPSQPQPELPLPSLRRVSAHVHNTRETRSTAWRSLGPASAGANRGCTGMEKEKGRHTTCSSGSQGQGGGSWLAEANAQRGMAWHGMAQHGTAWLWPCGVSQGVHKRGASATQA